MDGPAASDAERDLAARRRELEHEFEDKARELKAQHKRQLEALRQEQADWEAHKRAQAKELADRLERVRRQEANDTARVAAQAAAVEDVAALKADVAAERASKLEAKRALAETEARLAAAQARLPAARRVLAWSVAGALALAAAAFGLDLRAPGGPWLGVAGLLAAVAVGLGTLRARLGPGAGLKPD